MIKGMQKFVLKNLNREKILKEIVKITQINNIKIDGDSVSFCVAQKDAKKVKKILDKKGAKIKETTKRGLVFFLKTNVLKIGIVVPVLLFVAFFLISGDYIFNLQINGLERVDKNEIIAILGENGISRNCCKANVNTKEIEKQIQKLQGISFASVIVKGNTLIVNVKEQVYNPEYMDKDNFAPIVARHGGIITHIEVVQGTALVKVGQTVLEGQQLVAPYTINTDGKKLNVLPMADIKADVFYSNSISVADKHIKMEDTGEIFVKKQIFWGDNIIFDDGSTCTYQHFAVHEDRQFLANKNCLPLVLVTTIYFQQSPKEINNYFDLNKQSIINDCAEKTRQLVASYAIIKDEYYEITSVAGINRVTYTCVVSESIVP